MQKNETFLADIQAAKELNYNIHNLQTLIKDVLNEDARRKKEHLKKMMELDELKNQYTKLNNELDKLFNQSSDDIKELLQPFQK